MVNFEIVGKISVGKESETFKPYEEKEFNSGWINKTLNWNIISGDNRFNLRNRGGFFKDGHNDIVVFSKDGVDANGNKVKGEMFRIPWKERLTHSRLPEVVMWKKWIVELEKPGFRWELQNALDKVKHGEELTEEEIAKFGSSDVEGLTAALEKSQKKRKEFIAEADFVDFVYKVIASGKYADKQFKVTGTYDMQYSEENQRFYCNYIPQRIYLVEDEATTATANMTFFYDNAALVDAKEEKGKYYVNGYVQVYDNNRKENVFAPYTIAIPAAKDDSDLEKKREKVQFNRFTVEDEDVVYEYGIVVNLLSGAQKTELTEDMLTEEQQDSILLGELTLDDIRRELGSVYGDRVVENVFVKPARGFSKGREETSYTSDDLLIKPLVKEESSAFEDTEADSEDLFADDDDDDLFN